MALLIVKLDDPCPKLTQIRQLTPIMNLCQKVLETYEQNNHTFCYCVTYRCDYGDIK